MTDRIKTIFTCEHKREGCPYCATELADLKAALTAKAEPTPSDNLCVHLSAPSICTQCATGQPAKPQTVLAYEAGQLAERERIVKELKAVLHGTMGSYQILDNRLSEYIDQLKKEQTNEQ